MIYILTTRDLTDNGPVKGDQIVLKQFLTLSRRSNNDAVTVRVKRRFSLYGFLINIRLTRLLTFKYSFRSLLLGGIQFENFKMEENDKVLVIGHFLSSILVDKFPSGNFHIIDNEHKKNSSYPWKYFAHKIEGCLYKRELEYLRNHDDAKLLYVTSKDSKNLSNEFSLPLYKKGVDLPADTFPRDEFKLVFWGNLDYIPNRLAVVWFCDNIEMLKNRGYSVRIIGKTTIPSLIRKMKHSDIDYRGYVSNLYNETKDCGLFVAPMWTGSGVQNKILEALLFGIPCLISDYMAEQFEWEVARYSSVASESDFIHKLIGHDIIKYNSENIGDVGSNYSIENSLKSYNYIFK